MVAINRPEGLVTVLSTSSSITPDPTSTAPTAISKSATVPLTAGLDTGPFADPLIAR